MPVFDTPITTNDASIQKITGQTLPVLIYLFNRSAAAFDQALGEVAKAQAGKLLVVRVDAGENPQTAARYKNPALPALIGLKGDKIQAQTSAAKAADVKIYGDYLAGQGPKPAQPAASAAAKPKKARPSAVSDSSFGKEVLQSNLPVLVDFWADWCGPCHMVAPIVENMAQKYAGQLKVVKIDVDKNQQTASRYKTFSIPTLILFKNGREADRLVGAQPQPAIERFIKGVIEQK